MNYYERHLGDYARDTAHLTMLEHGAYGLLLDRYYATEQGIPADQAHRVARARTRDERAAVDAVLAEFFVLSDGVWTHGRVQREIDKAQTRIKAARDNGMRGGRPKLNPTGTDEKPTGLLPGSVLETQAKALHTPDTIHQEKEKPPRPSGVSPLCPDDVTPGVWSDWLSLRKAKKAPVTPTVVSSSRREAAKAGMAFEAFLAEWCARGSQGLRAEWLQQPRRVNGDETAYQRSQRERVASFAPGIAAKAPGTVQTIDMEVTDAAPRLVG